MKKYVEIFKMGLKEMTAYRFNVLGSVFFSFSRVILVFLLWSVIYKFNKSIASYSFNMMITYYILVTILSKLHQSDWLAWGFTSEIREGKFSKYMVRPVNPLGYFASISISKSVYFLLFSCVISLFWIFIFNQYFILPSSATNLLYAVSFFVLGMVFLILFDYFVSLMAFKIVEVSSFFVLKSIVIEFLSGVLIPLNLLPVGLVSVFKMLPFYYTTYYSVSVYLGQNTSQIPTALITIVLWDIVMLIGCILFYKSLVKYYEGVGI